MNTKDSPCRAGGTGSTPCQPRKTTDNADPNVTANPAVATNPDSEPASTESPKVNGGLGNGSQPELDHVQVRSLASIKPAPENDDVYSPISWDDPEINELAKSIKEHGLQDPIIVSRDGFIISGHRRRMAALLAGLDHVQVRVHPISRAENGDAFLKLLVSMNSQRIKSTSELLHESCIKIDPKVAHEQIVNDRKPETIMLSRSEITAKYASHTGRRGALSSEDLYLRIIPTLIGQGLAKLAKKEGKLEIYAFRKE
jgi:hypothetical protein